MCSVSGVMRCCGIDCILSDRPLDGHVGVHEPVSAREYGTGHFIVVPLLRWSGAVEKSRSDVRQGYCLTVRCSSEVEVEQSSVRSLAAEAQRDGQQDDLSRGHLSDDDDNDSEIFDPFDVCHSQSSIPATASLSSHGPGADAGSQGHSRINSRSEKYKQQLGATAVVDAREEVDARAQKLDKEHRERRLPLQGMSIEQLSAVEVKSNGLEAEATLCSISNTKRGSFDGLILPASIHLQHPRSVEGRALMIFGEKGVIKNVDIQRYDSSKRCLVFTKPLQWTMRSEVRIQIRPLLESRVLFKGVVAKADLDKPHWALRKSGIEYLRGALVRCLALDSDNLLRVSLFSMGANNVQALVQVESPDLSADRVAAFKERLDKQVSDGNVTALAQGAVQDAYKSILDGLRTSAVYNDDKFPANEESIWGCNWQTQIEERVLHSVQWVRPDILLKNLLAKDEVMKSALGAFSREDVDGKKSSPDKASRLRKQPPARAGSVSEKGVVVSAVPAPETRSEATSRASATPSKEDVALGLIRNKNAMQTASTSSATAGEESKSAVSQAPERPSLTLSLIGTSGHEVVQGKSVAGVGSTSFVAAMWMWAASKDFAARIRLLFMEKRGPPMSARLAYGCHSVTLFVRGELGCFVRVRLSVHAD